MPGPPRPRHGPPPDRRPGLAPRRRPAGAAQPRRVEPGRRRPRPAGVVVSSPSSSAGPPARPAGRSTRGRSSSSGWRGGHARRGADPVVRHRTRRPGAVHRHDRDPYGRHARLAMASLQELGPDQVVFQQRRAGIGKDADLHWALAQLGGRLVRSRVDNVLAGDRSKVEQVEIVFGADDQLHDLTSYTRHLGRDTTGQLLSKGVLMDRARSYLKGLITIEKSAIGTDSYLGEFGMNLWKSARAVAIPSLEIDQPDCRRAAHASSVGPIDETQLFYLESRGIPPDEARNFIVLGSSSRSSPGCRSRTPRTGSARRWRRMGRRLAASAIRGAALIPPCALSSRDPPDRPHRRRRARRGRDEDGVGGRHRSRAGRPCQRRLPRAPGHLFARVLRARSRLPDRGTLTCALHLSRFDLTDGEPLDPPAELPLAVYPVEIVDGRVMIETTARSRSTSNSLLRRLSRDPAADPAAFDAEDLDVLVALDSDPAVMRYITGGRRPRGTRCATTTCRSGSPTTRRATRMASGRRSSARAERSWAGSTCDRCRRTRRTNRSSAIGWSGRRGATGTPPRAAGR